MPELPEVETVRCALEKHLRGRVIKDINILFVMLEWFDFIVLLC